MFHDWRAFMDSRLRGNDGERFARMVRSHDCVGSDLSLSFPRRRESIGHHSNPHWVLFLNQPNLSRLGPFFQAHLFTSRDGRLNYFSNGSSRT